MTAPNDQDNNNSPMNSVDDGWGDASDAPLSRASASSDATSPAPAAAVSSAGSQTTDAAGEAGTADGTRRRKRRRRRGGGGGEADRDQAGALQPAGAGGSEPADDDDAEAGAASAAHGAPRPAPVAPKTATTNNQPAREGRSRDGRNREPREPRPPREPRQSRSTESTATEGAIAGPTATSPQPRTEGRGRRDQARGPRGAETRGAETRGAETRGAEIRGAETRGAETRGAGRNGPGRRAEPTDAQARSFAAAAELRTAPIAVPQRRDETDDNDLTDSTAVDGPWGVDDDLPVKAVIWPPEFANDDTSASPSTSELAPRHVDLSGAVANVTAVRFSANGRITWFDAGTLELAVGDQIIVDSERGPRTAIVAVAPQRRVVRDRNTRRVIGVVTEADRNRDAANAEAAVGALRIAKDRAAALKLPLKVFRAEYAGAADRGGKLFVYFTTDERVDVREFLRQISAATNARVELRQLGVRDEAKAVGGIGSCGLTLCCSTWLPDFVPVSIKMAKDQGLVLNPSKVSGQCGRLKCCLVYEQAGYAEMRKGLPKLGKRVISPRGEGRVVEVDVLRQRIRVSYGPGETEMLPAADIKPLFPSGNQGKRGSDADADNDAEGDSDTDDGNDTAGPATDVPTT